MTLSGGKRKVNKSLKAWVSFVKKVQKEEKLSYKDAIHRAKVRKDKGEKWMSGGAGPDSTTSPDENIVTDDGEYVAPMEDENVDTETVTMGGRRRTMRRSRGRGRGRGRTARRSRSRSRSRRRY
jgi:hypothetical protein